MLNKTELKDIEEIAAKYYMNPVLVELNRLIATKGAKEALSYLHPTILGVKDKVLAIIKKRKTAGKINDVAQASKTAVGSIFSNSIIYLFLKAKEKGLVKENIFITSKPKRFKELIAINVDGETQKPDLDLVVYSNDDKANLANLMIISL
ncbi:MAG: hypothetical protein LBD99_04435, partial [Candidatus Margulisbacteria bacterium]|nr:hypothetical protein [Candidatus Margulisiibacteriota bacterium]